MEEANANNDLSEHEKFMQDLLVGKTTRFGATLKKTMLPNGSVRFSSVLLLLDQRWVLKKGLNCQIFVASSFLKVPICCMMYNSHVSLRTTRYASNLTDLNIYNHLVGFEIRGTFSMSFKALSLNSLRL